MKINNNKRTFINSFFKWSLFLVLSQISLTKKIKAKVKPKIVVLGGGFGGGACLKYLSNFLDLVDLTVIDKYKRIQTCPFSNLVIGGLFETRQTTFNLNFEPKIKHLNKEVKFVNAEEKVIIFNNKEILKYDFLIMSPGIGFKENQVDGFSFDDKKNIPHCWSGGRDIKDFKDRLSSLENSSVIIISSPDYPYRCPPAPYERASMIANYLKKKKQKFKILIFDSKNSFTKQSIFFNEWKQLYGNSIEWISRNNGGMLSKFNVNYVVNNNGEKVKGDFIHIIPEQKASKIIFDSKLSEKDWCEIDPETFQLKNFKDVYVVGDSINAGDMPKSAFSAESQAKMLSINLINRILQRDYLAPVFLNTCYSFSAIDRAFSITSWYKLNENKNKIISLGSSQSNEIESIFERKKESIEAFGWYESITKSIYG